MHGLTMSVHLLAGCVLHTQTGMAGHHPTSAFWMTGTDLAPEQIMGGTMGIECLWVGILIMVHHLAGTPGKRTHMAGVMEACLTHMVVMADIQMGHHLWADIAGRLLSMKGTMGCVAGMQILPAMTCCFHNRLHRVGHHQHAVQEQHLAWQHQQMRMMTQKHVHGRKSWHAGWQTWISAKWRIDQTQWQRSAACRQQMMT